MSRDAVLFWRKVLVYFLIVFAAALLQTSFLAVLRPLGAVPDLMLLVALGAGYFCGAEKGGVMGIAAGVAAYALGDVGLALLPLLYMLVGAAAGLLVDNFFAGKFAVWCIYVFGAAVIKGGYSLLCCVIFSGELQLWAVLWRTLLPELLTTVILGAAVYYPIKKLSGAL